MIMKSVSSDHRAMRKISQKRDQPTPGRQPTHVRHTRLMMIITLLLITAGNHEIFDLNNFSL